MRIEISKYSGALELINHSGKLTLNVMSVFPVVPELPLTMRQVLTHFMGVVSRDGGIFEGEKCALISLYLLNDNDASAYETRVTFDDVGNQFESQSCISL